MTSYALLTYVLRGDVQGGLPILRWLLQLRGPNGGFQSTQVAAARHHETAMFLLITA